MSEIGPINYDDPLGAEARMEALPLREGSPYRYFKTRLYGRLHFVKSIRSEYASDPLVAAALAKEFDIGYSLDHPNIVKYLLARDGAIYEEYVDGLCLEEILGDENLSQSMLSDRTVVEKMIRQLLDALAYLHMKGVAYLDLKPANIMVTRIGSAIKLIDLGGCAGGAHDHTPAFTRQYAAPEQLSESGGARPLASTDLWQFAHIAKRMLSQCGGNGRYARFLNRCLQTDPLKRPADAVKALAEFDRIAASAPAGLRRYWWIAAVAAIAVISVVLTLMLTERQSNTAQPAGQAESSTVNTAGTDSIGVKIASPQVKPATGPGPATGPAESPGADAGTGSSAAGAAEPVKTIDKDSWQQFEDGTWTPYGQDFKLPPAGHPLHDKILDRIMQRSIDADVETSFWDMAGTIDEYEHRGLTYATLTAKQRENFDARLRQIANALRKHYQQSEQALKKKGQLKGTIMPYVESSISDYTAACKEFRLYELSAIREPWRHKKTFAPKPRLPRQ